MTDNEKARRFEKALALAGSTHSIADVMDKVRENRAQCWPNGDSVTITEILVYPRLRACNYWLSCGNLRECLDLEPAINAWALEQGCSIATITGRMGWLRLSQTPLGAGWKPQGVKLVKELR